MTEAIVVDAETEAEEAVIAEAVVEIVADAAAVEVDARTESENSIPKAAPSP